MLSRSIRRAVVLGLLTAAVLPGQAMADPAPYAEPGPTGFLPPSEPTTPPSVSGTAQAGGTLTGDRGTWPSDPSLSSEWLRCDDTAMTCETTGDTDTTYAVGSADVGLTIVLRVVADGGFGTRTRDARSSPIAAAPPDPVAPSGPAAPTNVTAPTISGDAREGQFVRASQGEWTGTDPITYSYGWVSCSSTCRAVSGANTYRVRRADVGRRLVVSVYGHNAAGSTRVDVSTGVVARPVASSNLKRLSPFPTLLVDGRVAGALTSISTLRLRRVPGGSTINIRCAGRGCPFRRSRVKVRSGESRTIALRRLQRRMRAGTIVVITVRKGNTLGKYIRLRFRNGLAPARIDRCVAPNSSKPLKCP